jgi:transcriptional regulator with XRE-family HTH domain
MGQGSGLRYDPRMHTAAVSIGSLLREWRQSRRMSQLDLAGEAGISARHMSFLETGRSLPSREMLLRLSERLDVPLRERNALLQAAGYAPMYRERTLEDPAMRPVRLAIDQLLSAHEPRPALAIDRHWNMVAANRMITGFLTGIEPALLQLPVNVLRLSLHPGGIAPRIANLAQWRGHLLDRLRRQIASTGDPVLRELLKEMESYPVPQGAGDEDGAEWHADVAIPFRYRTPLGILTFYGTAMIFGTPTDITLSELAIEAFFPADAETEQLLRQLAAII